MTNPYENPHEVDYGGRLLYEENHDWLSLESPRYAENPSKRYKDRPLWHDDCLPIEANA